MSDEFMSPPSEEQRARAPEHRTPVESTDALQGDGSSVGDTEGQPAPDALPPGQVEIGALARQAKEDTVAKPADGISDRAKKPVIDLTGNAADLRSLLEVGHSIIGMLDEMAANIYRQIEAADAVVQRRQSAEPCEEDWWDGWAAGKPLIFRGLKPQRQRRWH